MVASSRSASCLTLITLVALVVGCGSSRGPRGDGGTGSDAGSRDGGGADGGGVDAATSGTPDVHRPAPTTCPTARGGGDAFPIEGDECSADADCVAGTNGRCMASRGGAAINLCSYDECTTDSECAADNVCDCRADATSNAPNRCLPGDCVVDSDCGPGGYCSPSVAFDRINYPYVGYYCHTATDTCANDEECTPDYARCAYDPSTARWACSSEQFLPP